MTTYRVPCLYTQKNNAISCSETMWVFNIAKLTITYAETGDEFLDVNKVRSE